MATALLALFWLSSATSAPALEQAYRSMYNLDFASAHKVLRAQAGNDGTTRWKSVNMVDTKNSPVVQSSSGSIAGFTPFAGLARIGRECCLTGARLG